MSVFIRNVKEEDLKVDLQERSVSILARSTCHSCPSLTRSPVQLSLTVSLPTGSDIVFDLDPLAHLIDPSASTHRILQPKIELKLRKKDAAKWGKLEGDEQVAASMGASTLAQSCFSAS